MQIAFFVSGFPVVSETFILNQIVDFKKRGYKVHIYASERGNETLVHQKVFDYNLMADTVFLSELPKNRAGKAWLLLSRMIRHFSVANLKLCFRFLRNASAYGLSVYELAHFLGKPAYDSIHAHFGVNGVYLTKMRLLGLFPQSHFTTTFHGYDLEVDGNEVTGYRQLFRYCHTFTVNSGYSKRRLELLGCPPHKIMKMPVGLDLDLFCQRPVEESGDRKITILFVGRLIELKGPDLVISIAKMLAAKPDLSFQMLLVGEGEMKEKLEMMIRDAALEKVVFLLGPKTQEEVKELMNAADIFLFPGRTVNGRAETQGLVLQEAQAMGLPVVVSDAGGMKEGVIDGETGFVVEEGNIFSFAEKIELLAKSEATRKEMAVTGRRFVEKNFSIKDLNDRLLSIYRGSQLQDGQPMNRKDCLKINLN